jgi:hypothetical protein
MVLRGLIAAGAMASPAGSIGIHGPSPRGYQQALEGTGFRRAKRVEEREQKKN